MTTLVSDDHRPLSIARTFTFSSRAQMIAVLGPADANIALLESSFPALSIRPKDLELLVTGPSASVTLVLGLLKELCLLAQQGSSTGPETVTRLLDLLTKELSVSAASFDQSILSSRGRSIRPKTHNQKSYVEAIDQHTIVFSIGPAGTGKTYLAMAKAVQQLQNREVSRIILTRPAVEAGERLGFLPGSLHEKIDPYLRPLYDALHDMMDPESIPKLLEAGTIEVAPLAYMRGRTLNDAFIILDEAQNTTVEQMKMFLTRLGFSSKMVITGDVTQVDLPGKQPSGLQQVQQVLAGVPDISFCFLQASDVVRHKLVSDIVSAYHQWDQSQRSRAKKSRSKDQVIKAAAQALLDQQGSGSGSTDHES